MAKDQTKLDEEAAAAARKAAGDAPAPKPAFAYDQIVTHFGVRVRVIGSICAVDLQPATPVKKWRHCVQPEAAPNEYPNSAGTWVREEELKPVA